MKSEPAQHRLFFIDWLRILAFALLVPYHVGMYYVSWDWHVKSAAAGPTIEPLMALSSPWRLSLLFFIGGAACQFLLRKNAGRSFVAQRSRQLLWPLAFGMAVIVPPQAYYEVVTKLAYAGSYLDFMQLYLRAYPGFCHGTDCLTLPTWNHLWFLPYLWVYSLLAWALSRHASTALDGIAMRLARCRHWQWLLLPALPLAAARMLVGTFESTHNFSWDWYNHAQYLSIFLIGLLVARSGDAVWIILQRLRWPALLLALGAWALLLVYYRAYAEVDPPTALRYAQRLLYGELQWWAIAAACGFARQHLNSDSALRRWLAPAVFCVYVLHQTVIVLLTRMLLPWQLSPLAEGLVLIALTFPICLGGYALARHVPLLRDALGISKIPGQQRQSHTPREGIGSS
jgi:glucans biosynthesis protein C